VAIRKINSGQAAEIIATDRATRTDVPVRCKRTGNTRVDASRADEVIRCHI
jgi:TusA-related sulfurtransferase